MTHLSRNRNKPNMVAGRDYHNLYSKPLHCPQHLNLVECFEWRIAHVLAQGAVIARAEDDEFAIVNEWEGDRASLCLSRVSR